MLRSGLLKNVEIFLLFIVTGVFKIHYFSHTALEILNETSVL